MTKPKTIYWYFLLIRWTVIIKELEQLMKRKIKKGGQQYTNITKANIHL